METQTTNLSILLMSVELIHILSDFAYLVLFQSLLCEVSRREYCNSVWKQSNDIRFLDEIKEILIMFLGFDSALGIERRKKNLRFSYLYSSRTSVPKFCLLCEGLLHVHITAMHGWSKITKTWRSTKWTQAASMGILFTISIDYQIDLSFRPSAYCMILSRFNNFDIRSE